MARALPLVKIPSGDITSSFQQEVSHNPPARFNVLVIENLTDATIEISFNANEVHIELSPDQAISLDLKSSGSAPEAKLWCRAPAALPTVGHVKITSFSD